MPILDVVEKMKTTALKAVQLYDKADALGNLSLELVSLYPHQLACCLQTQLLPATQSLLRATLIGSK